MATTVIEVEVDGETARKCREADPEARRWYGRVLSGWLASPEERAQAGARLRESMSHASADARRRGLTPEILEEILHDGYAVGV
ncbi:MAG TPA: hypothetical protein VGM37_13340 [Armatimonadota bacterium]|jgi:hypothetical protein